MDTLFNLGTKTRLSAFGAQTGFDHFIQIWTQYRIEQAQWCNDYHRGSKRIGRRPCRHRTNSNVRTIEQEGYRAGPMV